MNEAMTGLPQHAEHSADEQKVSASERALAELGMYFHGSRGKLRLVGFVCQVLVASTIVFALISLVDLGSVLLHAILLVANSPLVGGDYAQRFVMDLPARNFIIDSTEAFLQHALFYAVVSLLLTATAEIYWTRRRASRLMPPAQAFMRN
ncbi:hypothetical protein A8H39_00260 [Paraburkholderia fungorum]|uniref:hypothetical protein n=1 Tax=Paraburkholderia fungorum TaxID=134537 RepID=UPI0004803189|nr:hypothetical protein [Paraburkholderia fungorum]PNE59616.1 hypothetical protein A8H39_00260 [Paraburkholderia fungorum]